MQALEWPRNACEICENVQNIPPSHECVGHTTWCVLWMAYAVLGTTFANGTRYARWRTRFVGAASWRLYACISSAVSAANWLRCASECIAVYYIERCVALVSQFTANTCQTSWLKLQLKREKYRNRERKQEKMFVSYCTCKHANFPFTYILLHALLSFIFRLVFLFWTEYEIGFWFCNTFERYDITSKLVDQTVNLLTAQSTWCWIY